MSGRPPARVVTVNGRPRDIAAGTTVADLLAALVAPDRGTAVAVNGDVVPRSTWGTTRLAGGDAVEILSAVQGG